MTNNTAEPTTIPNSDPRSPFEPVGDLSLHPRGSITVECLAPVRTATPSNSKETEVAKVALVHPSYTERYTLVQLPGSGQWMEWRTASRVCSGLEASVLWTVYNGPIGAKVRGQAKKVTVTAEQLRAQRQEARKAVPEHQPKVG